jgi:hypothetical protein
MSDRKLIRENKKYMIASAHLHLIPAKTPASPLERGYKECPCPKDCALHGDCKLCTAYHARKNRLPRCER